MLKGCELVDDLISKIYRNLEILKFSKDTNYDLLSELFYSCEGLKVLNCIETKQMIIHLAKYLFPQEIVNEVEKYDKIAQSPAKFRHLKINKTTGDIFY